MDTQSCISNNTSSSFAWLKPCDSSQKDVLLHRGKPFIRHLLAIWDFEFFLEGYWILLHLIEHFQWNISCKSRFPGPSVSSHSERIQSTLLDKLKGLPEPIYFPRWQDYRVSFGICLHHGKQILPLQGLLNQT